MSVFVRRMSGLFLAGGLAAAGRRVYLSQQDGTLLCLGSDKP